MNYRIVKEQVYSLGFLISTDEAKITSMLIGEGHTDIYGMAGIPREKPSEHRGFDLSVTTNNRLSITAVYDIF